MSCSPRHDGDGDVRHQFIALNAEFVQAGFGHVLRVGLQLGRGRGKLGATVARLVEQLAGLVQRLVNFRQAGTHLFRLDLQQAVAGLAGIALGIEIHQPDGDLLVLGLALQFLRGRRFDLQPQRYHPLDHFGDQQFDALQAGGRAAMPFFERRHPGQSLRRVLRGLVAPLAQAGQLLLARGREDVRSSTRCCSAAGNLHLQLVEQRSFFRALRFQPVQFLPGGLQALADSRDLGFQLLQHVAGRHGLLFGLALFAFQPVQQGSEVLDFAAQSEHAHFFVAQRLFQFSELAQHVAQFALHRQRTFRALLAAGHGHVVEAFARLREEERIGIFQRQLARERRDRERCSHRAAWAG